MECHYEEVHSEEFDEDKHKKDSWKPFLRQLLVASGICTCYFMFGLSTGSPTVYIPQIRKEANSSDVISGEMASWLSSVTGYAGVPFVFIVPVLSEYIGRKIPVIILCITSLISFAIFYFSTSPIHLLISAMMQGFVLTCNYTIMLIILTEYSSPKNRGLFLTLKSASFYWGIWVANATGTFLHWKNIAVVAFVCYLYTLTVFIWPESPYWLASKGRFEKCAASLRWLRGDNETAQKELKNLINTQIDTVNEETAKRNCFANVFKIAVTREFYLPTIICMLSVSLYHLSGKLVCCMYAIEIIKKLTANENMAYRGMLILDGVTVLSMYIGCILVRFCKRRTLLLVSSFIAISFLYGISLYLYLIEKSVIVENAIISVSLLTVFSVAISIGPIIISAALIAELLPLRFRKSSMIVLGVFSDAIMATVLKVSPYLFKRAGMSGAFLFYGLSASVCFLTLCKILPETKDKTLQEIEACFKKTPNLAEKDTYC